ncbi:SDR family oxidoreductase [Phormidium sp. LEGE 05292]|uniref:type I polyketide synthase n=1 Tax=[Phormidium] sp. LEGE 05292 TaxID=767427 RepID=UPI0018827F1E|nr:type I polyketide synthase [Phormidium sp. LEGE 05292]MBE9224523.1 SDR family oxidoreductase [Phormidium sp. LEGE 05292]
MSNSDIAIIGMSGRFPGAKNIDEFWQNLQDGKEAISFFSDEELRSSGIDETLINNSKYVKANAIVSDIELFDASFFDFSAREAEITDPQHRLFLEHAWEALENAGYNTQNYEGSIGIYAGADLSSYLLNNFNYNLEPQSFFQILIANDKDYLPTKVSYKLNLKGPSVSIQTACSTSLVAIHIACQSLLNGECDISLAGGVSIKVPQQIGYLHKEGMVTSPDGHCRTFDARAQGTVFGNGIGIVVLKLLEDAIADRDNIYAIIKGSAINNDGSLKLSYTAPSIDGQTAVISEAHSIASIEPETISYIEAHGTATDLGDPIEIAALTKAFGKRGRCALGSVKTNIGHLSAAAGVAGLIKTVLALKHRKIPPNLHFEQPNPKIDFANTPFYVNTQLSEWQEGNTPRRAGVSSFGIGGTNAHIVLEEAPIIETFKKSRPWQLLVLSAKTNSALETATQNLAEHLKQQPNLNLADVAYTLGVGRQTFDYRRILVCQNIDEAVKALQFSKQEKVFTHYQQPINRQVVFMFPGQGSQYVNMGQELYETEHTFREQVDICCELLKPHLNIDLRQVLYPNQEHLAEASMQLQQTAITQPALFVIEYALAQLWKKWGVHPTAAIGHSIGEYVAATIAGVFSLKDALILVATRGKLMQQLPSGSMIAIPLSETQILPFLGKELSLAAVNGISSCVISGSSEAIETLENHLTIQGIECRRLHTSHAFHSYQMEPILESFTQRVKQVSLQPPQIPFISNVTGTWITAEEATNPNYWAAHLRKTVQLASGLQELLQETSQILLEVGPGRTLTTLAKRHPNKTKQVIISSLRHPQETISDVAFLLKTLGHLWLNGLQVNWSGFYHHEQRRRLPLPTYPFERQRYWIEASHKRQVNQISLNKQPDIADWFYLPLWKQSVPIGPIKQGELLVQKSCILAFIDSPTETLREHHNLGIQLVKRLETEGYNVITVQIGTKFAWLGGDRYSLNPQQSNDYDLLVKELLAQQRLPEKIVHCWSVTPFNQVELELTEVEKAQDLGFYSLLFLAQALGKQNLTERFQITVISNNIQSVTGEEWLSPEKATLLSPVKVIPQEYPHITCRSIDITLPLSGSWQQEKLIEQLFTELIIPNSEQVIAYRGNHRWLQTFESIRLDESIAEIPRLREEGVYLITGGLGGIGLVLAEYLAKKVRAKLILLGRSSFPPREEWENCLHDRQRQQIQKIRELENLGAEVLVISADVANLAQMTDAIKKIELRFGQLNGVIHAAGIVGEKSFGAIAQTNKLECEQQFQSKVYGTLVLEKLLQNKKLDFCVLVSSLSSVLGGLGYSAYAAANIFMDAVTKYHNQSDKTPWIAINCDVWKLGVESGLEQTSLAEFAMKPAEGIQAFENILSRCQLDRVVVSTGNLQARIDKFTNHKPSQNKVFSPEINSPSLHPRPNLENAYVNPSNDTEQRLVEIWQQVLGVEPIGIFDNFFDLGGDSLIGIQLISQIRNNFQLEIAITHIFEFPRIADLAFVIEEIIIEELEKIEVKT